MDEMESDYIVEKWLKENDKLIMPQPSTEYEPHLLISKVRKHYMEYLIKILSTNYENHQKLLNKNIYLPSAIWRCAKMIEMSATQESMVVHLYRKSVTDVIKDIKNNTNKGLLYTKLYQCLHYAPRNDKKIQATLGRSKDCNCQCTCNQRKRVKMASDKSINMSKNTDMINNSTASYPTDILMQTPTEISVTNDNNMSTKPSVRMSIEMQQSDDELMQQLDKIFRDDENDEDLYDKVLCMADSSNTNIETISQLNNETKTHLPVHQEIQESQTGLDDRVALLSGMVANTTEPETQDCVHNRIKKSRPSKWLCEEYFQKVKLYELLDQIRDCNRLKYPRVKESFFNLFGDDSDEEDILSPMEENTEFVASCKERITPWVVEILTPYYKRGRIRGKNLFKSLAKHLISLIYQCSKYPYEYEVQSFVNDFLDSRKMIRCEADFKQFRIENF